MKIKYKGEDLEINYKIIRDEIDIISIELDGDISLPLDNFNWYEIDEIEQLMREKL